MLQSVNKNDESEDEEWDSDKFKMKMKQNYEAKDRQNEEELKVKEAQKLREIEVKRAEVNKMQQTFGLESILGNIEQRHKDGEFKSLIQESSKCEFLFQLMANLKKEGHRLLIFSMSKKMLNLIEEILKSDAKMKDDYKYLRIDGDTEISSRESICQ